MTDKRRGEIRAVSESELRQALEELGEFYQQFGEPMPPAIWRAHADTNRRFGL